MYGGLINATHGHLHRDPTHGTGPHCTDVHTDPHINRHCQEHPGHQEITQ